VAQHFIIHQQHKIKYVNAAVMIATHFSDSTNDIGKYIYRNILPWTYGFIIHTILLVKSHHDKRARQYVDN